MPMKKARERIQRPKSQVSKAVNTTSETPVQEEVQETPAPSLTLANLNTSLQRLASPNVRQQAVLQAQRVHGNQAVLRMLDKHKNSVPLQSLVQRGGGGSDDKSTTTTTTPTNNTPPRRSPSTLNGNGFGLLNSLRFTNQPQYSFMPGMTNTRPMLSFPTGPNIPTTRSLTQKNLFNPKSTQGSLKNLGSKGGYNVNLGSYSGQMQGSYDFNPLKFLSQGINQGLTPGNMTHGGLAQTLNPFNIHAQGEFNLLEAVKIQEYENGGKLENTGKLGNLRGGISQQGVSLEGNVLELGSKYTTKEGSSLGGTIKGLGGSVSGGWGGFNVEAYVGKAQVEASTFFEVMNGFQLSTKGSGGVGWGLSMGGGWTDPTTILSVLKNALTLGVLLEGKLGLALERVKMVENKKQAETMFGVNLNAQSFSEFDVGVNLAGYEFSLRKSMMAVRSWTGYLSSLKERVMSSPTSQTSTKKGEESQNESPVQQEIEQKVEETQQKLEELKQEVSTEDTSGGSQTQSVSTPKEPTIIEPPKDDLPKPKREPSDVMGELIKVEDEIKFGQQAIEEYRKLMPTSHSSEEVERYQKLVNETADKIIDNVGKRNALQQELHPEKETKPFEPEKLPQEKHGELSGHLYENKGENSSSVMSSKYTSKNKNSLEVTVGKDETSLPGTSESGDKSVTTVGLYKEMQLGEGKLTNKEDSGLTVKGPSAGGGARLLMVKDNKTGDTKYNFKIGASAQYGSVEGKLKAKPRIDGPTVVIFTSGISFSEGVGTSAEYTYEDKGHETSKEFNISPPSLWGGMAAVIKIDTIDTRNFTNEQFDKLKERGLNDNQIQVLKENTKPENIEKWQQDKAFEKEMEKALENN